VVTGLLLFLARHLTLVGIDSDEGKPQIRWGLPYLLRPTSAASDVEKPAAEHCPEMGECGLTWFVPSAGAEYDGILEIRRLSDLNSTMKAP
jgi:hypothetical protein